MSSGDGLLLLLGRLTLAILFLPDGFEKLIHLGNFGGHPLTFLWALLTALIELLGALAVLVGFRIRWAAIMMALFSFLTTISVHGAWGFSEFGRSLHSLDFMKSLAIAGGFLILSVSGAGFFSVDRVFGRRG